MKRAKHIYGSTARPRLSVYKGLRNIYAQVIDDDKGITLVSASTLEKTIKKGSLSIELAKQVGLLIAQRAKEKQITHVVFDRRDKKYHGRIKAVADGAREGGLIF